MIEKEKALEKQLVKKVSDMHGWCIKLACIFIAGLPDRMCLFRGGRVAFAEMKETGKKPSKIQSVRLTKLKALGFHVEVLDSTESIDKFLERYA